MDIVFYHFPASYYSQVARLGLVEKGVEFESRLVDIAGALANLEPWYLRMNPRGTVPILEHDGRIVADSMDILRYADRALSGSPLLPSEVAPAAESWVQRLHHYPMQDLTLGQRLVPNMDDLFRRKLARIAENREKAPDLKDLYDAKEADLRRLIEAVADARLLAAHEARMSAMLVDLDADLSRGVFAAGDRWSVADALWAVCLARLELLRLTRLWEGMSRVESYRHSLHSRASFRKVVGA